MSSLVGSLLGLPIKLYELWRARATRVDVSLAQVRPPQNLAPNSVLLLLTAVNRSDRPVFIVEVVVEMRDSPFLGGVSGVFSEPAPANATIPGSLEPNEAGLMSYAYRYPNGTEKLGDPNTEVRGRVQTAVGKYFYSDWVRWKHVPGVSTHRRDIPVTPGL